ncbi:TatD DNase family protein [Chromohalobacter marismortui]|uniref:TatD DNase family protein n=1 Tax=Chromohalobacter marismortui TaxID=42055 RepID=A0A4R7NPT1_9GAMM|nr:MULTISPECIES: TatD family hydrolase [Chromohalobacter]MCI0508983.1 TatD family hydrolase [Chromohalobacter sp.]MCI0592286.1 TatD family hydrolase [Chromohalobacter sp.]TDU22642.1 TatD DNase family protein [Chromohalobacter marismortui]
MSSTLIDAHCHLDFDVFDEDRDAVLARAATAGVGHCIVPGTTRERWPQVADLGRRRQISVCFGLHPYFLQAHALEDTAALEVQLDAHPEAVALGECGIDARLEDLNRQWQLFDAQLRIAKQRHLPVVIHCVQANDQVAKRLRQLALPAGGLIHAFSGSPEQARGFLDLGFVLGFGGAATYTRAKRLHRAIRSLPDDGYVLETDSPDMPLSGAQGQRNEPSRVHAVCETVAELRKQSYAAVATQSTATARRLFGLASHQS